MQGDDPPFLTVGTDVSAKYKGAFCEAKIKKVVRNIKCKVTLKGGGTVTVNDDTIKGNLRVGNTVEVKQDPKKEAVEAVITKMQDCSQYTVVFDDGDITTLRRSALCLKSGRHFNESETLDQLPLTHPEHFSTPVIAGRRGRRGRAQSEESEPETRRRAPEGGEREPHAGRVVLVETASGGERRRPHQASFPALVVDPTAQDTVKIKVKEDYIVRSFKDGRYYTVPKKEAREFRKGSAPLEWGGVEAALQYLNNGVLPPHWDRDTLFNEPGNASDDSSDDEPREEKDHFVAQLYKFMDDRGTPLNRNPTIATKDIDLYKLFRVVQKLGGYNRVTNQNQWKTIAAKMGFHPATNSITNLCKQAYKKFLHSFEDFYRKLGVTLVAHPRGARTPPAGRSLIRDRDKQQLQSTPSTSTAPSTPTMPIAQAQSLSRAKEREKEAEKESEKPVKPRDKSEEKTVVVVKKDEKAIVKSEKEKEKEKVMKEPVSDEDSADNQPLATPAPVKVEKEEKKEKEKPEEKEKEKERVVKVSIVKSRSSLPNLKREHERRTPKPRRPISTKSEGGSGTSSGGSSVVRSSRRPHASTDSDSSGRVSRCGINKKTPSRRSQSANSASSGNTIASTNSSKRARKRKSTTESSPPEGSRASAEPRTSNAAIGASVGDKLKVYYGPTQSESKVTYEAKVIEISGEGMLRVHYTGWNTRYDEWIKPQRIALNVTRHERLYGINKDGSSARRARVSRIQQERHLRSDSDSDSDSEEEAKPPPKKLDEKPPNNNKASSSTSKEDKAPSTPESGERNRKRPSRTVPSLPNTPPTPGVSPPKRPRAALVHASHQGRDYDLNEIRSELKGLNTVKTEPEELIKQESSEKIPTPPPVVEPQPDKQAEDVYEFKEPEPFEFELHDEKKKRTHRIFDDVSPKYTSIKSIVEDLADDTVRPRSSRRSPSLSPFRDFSARDAPGRHTPEDESRDDLFSLDGDSFPGDSSSGPIFEGFTPAKNQETYSKKNVTKIRKLIDDSPESHEDDDQSSDEEAIDTILKEEIDLPPLQIEPSSVSTEEKTTESTKEESKESETAVKQKEEVPSPKILQLKDSPPKPTVEPILDKLKETVKEKLKVEHKEKPKVEQKDKPKVEQKDKPKVVEPKEKPKIEPKEKPKVEPKEKPKVEPKEKPKVESKEKPKVEPKEKPKVEPKEKPKIDPKEKPKVDPKEKPKVEAQEKPVERKENPAIEQKDKPMVELLQIKTKIEIVKDPPNLEIIKDKPNIESVKDKYEAKLDTTPSQVVQEKIRVELVKDNSKVKLDAGLSQVAHDSTEKEQFKPEQESQAIPLPEISTPHKKATSPVEHLTSALIAEESKSEPDSPARMDELITDPPPAFLLHSEGPKIAEKLLKAINSAKKRISNSPPPQEDAKTPRRVFSKVKVDLFKSSKLDAPKLLEDANKSPSKLEPTKTSPRSEIKPSAKNESSKTTVNIEIPKPAVKIDSTKPASKVEPPKTAKTENEAIESVFRIDTMEKSVDPKREKFEASLAPLQSALDVLERRRSGSELPLNVAGKSNKVLSDTIQKLSSQIGQNAANIPLPTFPPEERSESSDSDDSDRRLIIDKLSEDDTDSGSSSSNAGRTAGTPAPTVLLQDKTKSPVEWSAGESLLMLEDFCKAERQSVPTVPKPSEEDSNISILLCEETIPGSPAPEGPGGAGGSDAPSCSPVRPSRSIQMPFASAPSNSPEEEPRKPQQPSREMERERDREREREREREKVAAEAEWELDSRDPMLDNTPPTTPESSLNMSPHRDQRLSDRDSPVDKGGDDDMQPSGEKPTHEAEKLFSGRSRKASECSAAGASAARRARRSRRDSDERQQSTAPLKYNFYVELDPTWDCNTRINLLTTRLAELRRAYHNVKTELAAVDRRRKKLRRKEREAVKAAKAACL